MHGKQQYFELFPTNITNSDTFSQAENGRGAERHQRYGNIVRQGVTAALTTL